MDESLVLYHSPLGLFRSLSRLRPDIIQGVEPFSRRLLPYLYAAFAFSRRQRLPLLIVTFENRPLATKYGLLWSVILRGMLRPVFNHAQLIIRANNGAKGNVRSVGPYEHKLEWLMYGTWGVDPEEFSPNRDGREPSFGPGPVLLFVGRLHAEKGVFDLLHAFGLLRKELTGAKLVLVGDGPARSRIVQMLAEHDWGGEVILTGTIKNRDLPPLFRAADLFAAPSISTRKWEEQVGMTNIQAMACGVPVVSTRSGAIPEYVPDGVAGILVRERDPQALAEGILHLLHNPTLRKQMGEAGRAYALEHYDARKNVAKAEEIILERCLRS